MQYSVEKESSTPIHYMNNIQYSISNYMTIS